MANFNITIDKNDISSGDPLRIEKIIPSILYIGKLLLLGSLTHFMIIPLLFETITFLGELRSVWQILFTVVITTYLSDLIKLKIKGRDWF